jgi:hypothetical protein
MLEQTFSQQRLVVAEHNQPQITAPDLVKQHVPHLRLNVRIQLRGDFIGNEKNACAGPAP